MAAAPSRPRLQDMDGNGSMAGPIALASAATFVTATGPEVPLPNLEGFFRTRLWGIPDDRPPAIEDLPKAAAEAVRNRPQAIAAPSGSEAVTVDRSLPKNLEPQVVAPPKPAGGIGQAPQSSAVGMASSLNKPNKDIDHCDGYQIAKPSWGRLIPANTHGMSIVDPTPSDSGTESCGFGPSGQVSLGVKTAVDSQANNTWQSPLWEAPVAPETIAVTAENVEAAVVTKTLSGDGGQCHQGLSQNATIEELEEIAAPEPILSSSGTDSISVVVAGKGLATMSAITSPTTPLTQTTPATPLRHRRNLRPPQEASTPTPQKQNPPPETLRQKRLAGRAESQMPLRKRPTMAPATRKSRVPIAPAIADGVPVKDAAEKQIVHQIVSKTAALGTPRSSRFTELRALALTEIPISVLASADVSSAVDAANNSGRPQRSRIRPLEAWRNERMIYERPQGSKTPKVAGVALNMAPRPKEAPPRHFDRSVLQVASLKPQGALKDIDLPSVTGSTLKRKVFALPAWSDGQQPYNIKLGPSRCVLHVFEGSVRCFCDLESSCADEVVLGLGDTAVFPENMQMSVALAKVCIDSSDGRQGRGARFLWVEVTSPNMGQ